MRSQSHRAALSLIGLLIFLTVSCRTEGDRWAERHTLEPAPPGPGGSIINSGKSLSGDFVYEGVKDDYAQGNLGNLEGVILSFKPDGSFRRESSRSGPAGLSEEGSYVITTDDSLLIYVVKKGDQLLESAVVERYTVKEMGESSLTLGLGETGLLRLRRR